MCTSFSTPETSTKYDQKRDLASLLGHFQSLSLKRSNSNVEKSVQIESALSKKGAWRNLKNAKLTLCLSIVTYSNFENHNFVMKTSIICVYIQSFKDTLKFNILESDCAKNPGAHRESRKCRSVGRESICFTGTVLCFCDCVATGTMFTAA